MLRFRFLLPPLLLLTLVVTCAFAAAAQDDSSRRTDAEAVQEVTQTDIDAGREQLATAKELDEVVITSITNIYDQAAKDLAAAQKMAQQQATQSSKLKTAADDTLKATNDRNTQPDALDDYQISPTATAKELDKELKNLSATLKNTSAEEQEIANEPTRRQERLKELPRQVAEAEAELKSVNEQLEVPPIAGEPPEQSDARAIGLLALRQRLIQEISAYRIEQDYYLATTKLTTLKAERKAREVKRLSARVDKLRDRLNQVLKAEVKELAAEKKAESDEAKKSFDELKTFALLNDSLSQQLDDAAGKVAETSEEVNVAESQLKKLQTEYETAESRVKTVKLSDAMGGMLRQAKTELIENRRNFSEQNTIESTVLARVEIYRFQDLLEEVEAPDAAADRALEKLANQPVRKQPTTKLSPARLTELRAPLIELFQSRKEMLNRLISLQGDLIDELNRLGGAQRAYTKQSGRYSDFIDQHILWIRSAPPVGYGQPVAWTQSLAWLTNVEHWQAVGQSLTRAFTRHLPLALPWVVLALLLVGSHLRTSRGIYDAGIKAEKRACRDFGPTATALTRTVLKSLMWPSLLYVLGKLILLGQEFHPFCVPFGLALTQSALLVFPVELLRQTCRGKGLAEAHSEWTPHSCKAMKRNLDSFIPTAAVLMIVILTLRNHGNEAWNNTLGRALLAIVLVLSAVVLYRMMRPGGAFFQQFDASSSVGEPSNWFMQIGYLRFIAVPAIPIVLLIFSLAGYHYTAIELGKVALETTAVAVVMLILYMGALRLLLVRRRRLRYEQLTEQREQLKKSLEETSEGLTEATLPIELKTESGLDITDVSRQARELTGVLFGLVAVLIFWNLWQDLLPATRIFDEWGLWATAYGEDGEAVGYVTLRDLLVSFALFGLTFLGVRNIPGMLELLLLKQLPLDSGSRYAISTIVRYIITVVGVILALSFLKISWTKYSWLVAAISVGLGFGLQEIVANFVSGLILLLERPVRVGDVITIDGTTGVVSRIQMRATTVTNWDNQELVVPNKDLITGKLMNWTLSSVINRISIKVGVSYASDPSEVKEILLDVAKNNSDVLDDPEPLVSFEEFGDSSLNFKLRCCITGISRRYLILHDINTDIYNRLKLANIEIPFPQRDVNMKLPDGFTADDFRRGK